MESLSVAEIRGSRGVRAMGPARTDVVMRRYPLFPLRF
jgi:hypothetical protein